MHFVSFIFDLILAGYIGWEVLQFNGQYRQLKQDIANGDTQARTRVYYRALAFEWISALLAVIALEFDWNRLNPASLDLGGSQLMLWLSSGGGFDRGAVAGVLCGIVLGTVGFAVARLRANRRGAVALASPPRWRRLLPDFSALLPVSARERILWAAVAVSAGVCEEVVFRGWLLATLHGTLGLAGTTLVLSAAAIFGLAHAYQRAAGMVLTAVAGIILCLLYIKTGSLLVPILLHILIDLRFAFLPAPRAGKVQAYA
jgi:CAAX protease family protein